jgi:serine protease Do
MGAATALRDAGRLVAETTGSSIVRIGSDGGRGCGVVVGDGLVLTNAHNLRDRTTTVTFGDGRVVQGSVLGADLDGDLAVLEVDTAGARPIEWAAQTAGTGELAFTVSRAGDGGTRVTFGMVSGADRSFRGPRGRRVTGSVEHTAPLARGSSGSALVDEEGRLLGINTSRIGEGFYLAVPATAELRDRVDALARGESPERVHLGVGLAPAHVARRLRRSVGLPERDGLLVRAVEAESPAARAGVEVGDLITSADGSDVATIDALFEALDRAAATGSLALHVVRGVDEIDLSVRFDDDATATEGSA